MKISIVATAVFSLAASAAANIVLPADETPATRDATTNRLIEMAMADGNKELLDHLNAFSALKEEGALIEDQRRRLHGRDDADLHGRKLSKLPLAALPFVPSDVAARVKSVSFTGPEKGGNFHRTVGAIDTVDSTSLVITTTTGDKVTWSGSEDGNEIYRNPRRRCILKQESRLCQLRRYQCRRNGRDY